MKTLGDLMRAAGEPTEIRSNGECHYPCPKCGGHDRFIVRQGGERGYCRQCYWQPDAIQYLRDIKGMKFKEAAAEVGKELPPRDPRLNRKTYQLLSEFETWRVQRFVQAYQALYAARARLVNVQFAQRCFQCAPTTFNPGEKAEFATELMDAETDFQAMQEAFLLMSPDGDEATAEWIWVETQK